MTDQHPPGSTPRADDLAQTWSIEHYGFDLGAAPGTASPTPTNPADAATDVPRRPRSRVRALVVSGALALALVTGTAGFAVAQASVNGRDSRIAQVHGGSDGRGPSDGQRDRR